MEWLRLYTDMPNDPKIGTLSDSEFRTWVELLCLAGREGNGGSTAVNINQATWCLRRDVSCDVSSLVTRNLVFIEEETEEIIICNWQKRQFRSDNSTERTRKYREKKKAEQDETSQERHSDALEQNREEKNIKDNGEKRQFDSIPYVDVVEAYHKFCPSLPKVLKVTDKRRRAIKTGWTRYQKNPGGFPAVLDNLFKKAEASDFLTGRNGGWGGACFDWLLKEDNLVKVIEGNYDNKGQAKAEESSDDDELYREALRRHGVIR